MTNLFDRTEKRRSPLPDGPWILSMQWHDVLFLHWPIPVQELEPHVPDSLTIETHNDTAWLGIVPFTMSGIRPRLVPSLPYVSVFPEINIRTYVNDGERSGVWFFSLDASSWFAVRMARLTFSLNYFHADMSVSHNDETVHYSSMRKESENGTFHFEGRYEPIEKVEDDRGEFEDFLTERYYLFSEDDRGRVYRGAIHHEPWDLYRADCEIDELSVKGHPKPTDQSPSSILYSPYQDVRAWFPQNVS